MKKWMLTAGWLLATVATSHANEEVIWSMDKSSDPYLIQIEVNGTRYSFGQITSAGVPTPYFPGSTCDASKWQSVVSSVGVFTCTQPAFSNISGQATLTQLPTLAASRLWGNPTVGAATPVEIPLGSTLAFSGGELQTGAVSGDATSSANSFALTLATVNSNVGSFGSSTNCISITVNAKGLITAASEAACTGTVSSVGASFTGGLVSVSGTPVTTSGTLAFTVAGTSGGVPYFSSASTWASSGALTADLPVIGGGTGAAPTVGTRSGNTTAYVTTTGTQTSGDCVKIDANGNHIANGSACPTAAATAANVQVGTSTTTYVTPSALSGSAAIQTLTDGATINWDVSAGYNAKLTLTASGHTQAAPTNVIAGITYVEQVCQDGTGSRTMSWNAAYNWGGAGTPTLTTTANKCDVVTCYATAATPTLDCSIAKGF